MNLQEFLENEYNGLYTVCNYDLTKSASNQPEEVFQFLAGVLIK